MKIKQELEHEQEQEQEQKLVEDLRTSQEEEDQGERVAEARKEQVRNDTCFLAESFAGVKIFLEAASEEGFIQIQEPQLHRFQLSQNLLLEEKLKSEEKLKGFIRAEGQDIDRWRSEQPLEVDLTKNMDPDQFGKLETDPETGERYMLMPIDVEFLIDPHALSPELATEYLKSYEYYKEIVLSRSEDPSGQTILLQPLVPGQGQGADDDQPNWEYHLHDFQVPKLSFPFELTIGTELDRKMAGDQDLVIVQQKEAEILAKTEIEMYMECCDGEQEDELDMDTDELEFLEKMLQHLDLA